MIFSPPSFFILCGWLCDSQMKSCDLWDVAKCSHLLFFCCTLKSWTPRTSLTQSSLATSLPRKETERLPALHNASWNAFFPRIPPRPACKHSDRKRFLRKTLLRSLENIAEDCWRILHSNPPNHKTNHTQTLKDVSSLMNSVCRIGLLVFLVIDRTGLDLVLHCYYLWWIALTIWKIT